MPRRVWVPLAILCIALVVPGVASADPGSLIGEDIGGVPLNPSRYVSRQVEGSLTTLAYGFARAIFTSILYDCGQKCFGPVCWQAWGCADPPRLRQFNSAIDVVKTAGGVEDVFLLGGLLKAAEVLRGVIRGDEINPTFAGIIETTYHNLTYNHGFVSLWQSRVRLLSWIFLFILVAVVFGRWLLARTMSTVFSLAGLLGRIFAVGMFTVFIGLFAAGVIECANAMSSSIQQQIFASVSPGSGGVSQLFTLYRMSDWEQEERNSQIASFSGSYGPLTEEEKQFLRVPRNRLEQVLGLDFYAITAAIYVLAQFVRILIINVLLIVGPLAAVLTIMPETRRIAGLWLTAFLGVVFAQPAQVLVLTLGVNLVGAIQTSSAGAAMGVIGVFLLVSFFMLAALAMPVLVQRWAGVLDFGGALVTMTAKTISQDSIGFIKNLVRNRILKPVRVALATFQLEGKSALGNLFR